MRRTLIALALTVMTALGASVAGPTAYAATGPTSLTLAGRGNGHGHGMSQYGAQGRAVAGQTTRQIMSAYYPGTRWGTATGTIAVWISEDTTADLVVANRAGLTMQALTSKRTWNLQRAGARRWKLVPVHGGADTRLMVLTSTWQTVRTVVGTAQLGAGGAPMTLYYPGGSRTYRGVLRSAGGASRSTVNVVSLETYLRGVVPQEMPALWKPAAVRSQAVAARTYAAYERAHAAPGADYQICDTSHCQVYAGASAEYPASDAAIAATAHQVLTYGGQPAFTQFSASNGGYSVAVSGFPYLQADPDPYDTYAWSATVQATAIEAAYPQIGDFQKLVVLSRDGRGSWGGRITSVQVVGSTGSATVTGAAFADAFGLRTTLFHQVPPTTG